MTRHERRLLILVTVAVFAILIWLALQDVGTAGTAPTDDEYINCPNCGRPIHTGGSAACRECGWPREVE